MTLDEAIKLYTNNAEYERIHGSLQGCLDFKQLADWLKELKQLREQTRWIPVKERLPKIADCYAVIEQIGSDLIVGACYFDGINTWHNDNWINHERNYLTNIVFWQPLPKPYKAESEVE